LDRTQFGSPVAVEEDFVGQVAAKSDSPRRSIYLQVRRSKPISLFTAFDAPVMTVNCERRVDSTTAPQALMLMNSDFVLKHAEHFAKRVRAEAKSDTASASAGLLNPQVSLAWQLAYQRPINPAELQAACEFVQQQAKSLRGGGFSGDPDQQALTNLCQQLISSNEFLYVD
jgi:hypothetical protein